MSENYSNETYQSNGIIEYDVGKSKILKSYIKDFGWAIVVSLILFFSGFLGYVFLFAILPLLLVYLIFRALLDKPYKVKIDNYSIKKITKDVEKKIQFTDVKSYYLNYSRSRISMRTDPHGFFRSPYISIYIPNEDILSQLTQRLKISKVTWSSDIKWWSMLGVVVGVIIFLGFFIIWAQPRTTSLNYEFKFSGEVLSNSISTGKEPSSFVVKTKWLYNGVTPRDVKVIYDDGYVTCFNQQAKKIGRTVIDGNQVEVYGIVTEKDVVTTCKSTDYFIKIIQRM